MQDELQETPEVLDADVGDEEDPVKVCVVAHNTCAILAQPFDTSRNHHASVSVYRNLVKLKKRIENS